MLKYFYCLHNVVIIVYNNQLNLVFLAELIRKKKIICSKLWMSMEENKNSSCRFLLTEVQDDKIKKQSFNYPPLNPKINEIKF